MKFHHIALVFVEIHLRHYFEASPKNMYGEKDDVLMALSDRTLNPS